MIKERSRIFERNWQGRIPARKAASSLHTNGAFVVSPAALEGPPVWVEQKYYETLFFSDALKRQIEAAGLAKAFALRPVDVISE